jgi:hypothetical protein
MMAFFLVMWLAAQDSTIRTAIAGYISGARPAAARTVEWHRGVGQGGIDNAGMPTVVPRKAQGMLEAEQRALVTAAEHIKQHMAQFGGGAARSRARSRSPLRTTKASAIELVDRSLIKLLRHGQQRAGQVTSGEDPDRDWKD